MCMDCETRRLSRRTILAGAAALAATASSSAALLGASPALAQDAVSPDEALKRLQDGNARYVTGVSVNRDYSVGRAARALGQRPFAAIVSCADSRVAPEFVFDQGPGDLFVVRVAGNFVNEDGLASLEYGTSVLGCSVVMVLGHSNCGAVRAAIDVANDGAELPGHLPSLTTAIKPAVETAMAGAPDDLLAAATTENVRMNVAYLQTAAPILSDLVGSGKVTVVGGMYELASGMVKAVD